MLSHPGRGRRSREARPGRLRRRMEMGRHPRAGGVARRRRGGSIRAPATIFPAPFPIWSTPWISTPRSTANCWSATPPQWTGTFSDLQQRLNRKTVSPKMRERFPAFVRCYDCLQIESEDLRPCPSSSGGASGGFRRPARPVALRPLADHRLRQLGGARGTAQGAAASDHRRSDDQAAGFALCRRAAEGAVVQVEARPAHGRCGADVCAARPRQALQLLFRLHLRRLVRAAGGAANWCRSARPISASPTRN